MMVTHCVDVAQREVIHIELLGNIYRSVHNNGRLEAVVSAMEDIGQADESNVLVIPATTQWRMRTAG